MSPTTTERPHPPSGGPVASPDVPSAPPGNADARPAGARSSAEAGGPEPSDAGSAAPAPPAVPPSRFVRRVRDELAKVVAGLPGGGEARPGQAAMADAVAEAISRDQHLVVRAGTGTGKTLAYLVPSVLSGKRVVVATATKALQDQLAGKDLPFLAEHVDHPFTYAVLKGRSNYVCVQRLAEVDRTGTAATISASRIGPGADAPPDDTPSDTPETGAPATGGGSARAARSGDTPRAGDAPAVSAPADGTRNGGGTSDGDRAGRGHRAGDDGPGEAPDTDLFGDPVTPPAPAGRAPAASGGAERSGPMAAPSGPGGQLALDGLSSRADQAALRRIVRWAATTESGDRAELPDEPDEATWAAVSTTSRDCPGARRCPRGADCFAEAARDRAAAADVVVVNLHLYGLDLASDNAILPEHDAVVIDEAHLMEDTISSTAGIEIGPGRFTHLGRLLRGILAEAGSTVTGVNEAATTLTEAIVGHRDQRITAPLPTAVTDALVLARTRVAAALDALRNIPDDATDDASARAQRARQAATSLVDELDAVAQPNDAQVLWVTGPEHAPALRLAPIDVAGLLRARLWSLRPAVLTSATLAPGIGPQLGLPQRSDELLDVGSPFDYPANGLLYCASDLPRPTDPRWADATIDEIEALVRAAGGRTLALFTSYRAMHRAVDTLRPRLPYTLLAQGDLPKPRLVERFSDEPETCLFATTSYWQGIDIPGPSLSLVTIDRLPFPRPDDPLLQARREKAGDQAFVIIDVPRAATLLAQGAGRLIRTANDRGAVAILDPRLATARYGPKIVATLPKMRRTKDRAEVERFLRDLRGA
jgi:ATP-dependent DNA helicase DinG